MVSEPFPAMAPDTRSTKPETDLEGHRATFTTVAENNRAILDQNSTDIPDLKVTISRIQASLKELAASMASLTSRGQGSSSLHRNPHIQFGSYGAPSRIASIRLLAETEEEIAEAEPKEDKPASFATVAPAILAKATMAFPQHLVVNASCKDGENFTSQSLEGLDVSESEYDKEGDEEQQQNGEEEHNDAAKASSGEKSRASEDKVDEVDEELKALKLQYQSSSSQTSYAFVKASNDNPDNDDDKGAYDDGFGKTPEPITPVRKTESLMEEFEEAANGGVQSLTLGALDNSFLVNDMSVQGYRNVNHEIHGKGVPVKLDGGKLLGSSNSGQSAAKKALLMRADTDMMLISPMKEGKPHAPSLQQLDLETGKVVTEWKFEKDGADITMRDITKDTKGSRLDPSELTFLGLDDNRLCQWDMHGRKGMVQSMAVANSPELHWNQGHQFSRGTSFQCFATTGDGSIVVGPLDEKIWLYSKTLMRQAKTAFLGLGSPITHVDVTYDGKWVFGTTNTYLVLICTLFTGKEGKNGPKYFGYKHIQFDVLYNKDLVIEVSALMDPHYVGDLTGNMKLKSVL